MAELVEIFQWLTEAQSADLDADTRTAVAEEIADVPICLARVSDRLEIDLPQAVDDTPALTVERYFSTVFETSPSRSTSTAAAAPMGTAWRTEKSTLLRSSSSVMRRAW